MLLRLLPQSTLAWLTDADLLPSWRDNGRFTPSVGSVTGFALSEGQQAVMHYAALDGPLYADEAAWRRAVRVVSGFTAEAMVQGRGTWRPLELFFLFEDMRPTDVLDAAHSALTRAGLAAVDRNDRTSSALFRLEDTCPVLELPEPYGKWFQHRDRKPAWAEPKPLRLEVCCTVEARRGAGSTGLAAALQVDVSTLAPTLAGDLHTALAGSRRLSRRALANALLPSARTWLAGPR